MSSPQFLLERSASQRATHSIRDVAVYSGNTLSGCIIYFTPSMRMLCFKIKAYCIRQMLHVESLGKSLLCLSKIERLFTLFCAFQMQATRFGHRLNNQRIVDIDQIPIPPWSPLSRHCYWIFFCALFVVFDDRDDDDGWQLL